MDLYLPFNSVDGDRRHPAEDLALMIASLYTNGVHPEPNGGLFVQAAGGWDLRMTSGKCIIEGRIGINTNHKAMTVAPPDGVLHRVDRVVLRCDFRERLIQVYVKTGTPSATPAAPALQRDADAYELSVASVYIARNAVDITQAAITDERPNQALCGFVTAIPPLDTQSVFAQYTAAFEMLFARMETDIAIVKREAIEQATSASMEIVREFVDEATVTMDNAAANANAAADRAISAASNLSLSAGSFVLPVAGWVLSGAAYTQTLHAAGAGAASVITLSYAPEPGGVTDNKVAFETAGIWMTEQEDDEITFACTLLPDMDISINLTYGQEVT